MSEVWHPQPHHTEMVEWVLARRASALWCGMGTGKTSVVLTAVSTLILEGASKGVLVVCPHRVGVTWKNQIERWDHLNWLRISSLRTEAGIQSWLDGSSDIYWINSERLNTIEKVIKGKTKRYPGFVEKFIKGKKIPVDTLVIDEISLAKNPKSSRFNAIRPYLHDIPGRFKTQFKRLVGLTGTPHSNSYADTFAPVRLLDPEIFGTSFYKFRSTYMKQLDYMGWSWGLQDGAKERINEAVSDLALVIRSEDVLDLPACTIVDVDVVLPPKVMKSYRQLEKDLLLPLEEGDVEALSAAALTQKLLQAACGVLYTEEGDTAVLHDAKISALKKVRKEYKDEPLLVVGQYIHERKRILEEFPDAVAFHEDRIPDWEEGNIPMFVAQYAQLAFGIDGLQNGGRLLVLTCPTYSWEMHIQLIKRLVRPGQEHETRVIRLLAADTIDWAVASVLTDKEEGEKGLLAAVHALQQLRKST